MKKFSKYFVHSSMIKCDLPSADTVLDLKVGANVGSACSTVTKSYMYVLIFMHKQELNCLRVLMTHLLNKTIFGL